MRKIILDCDPGHDDAFAILLALASNDLDLIGITTVAGNVGLKRATANALTVRAMSGRLSIPIFAGADKPLIRPLVTAEHIHGQTGLDTASGNTPDLVRGEVERENAVDFIVSAIREAPEKTITLVPTGPLTNIALAIKQAPDIASKIQEIVFMGGAALDVGNVTPAAEFNIYVDPDAAKVVFNADVPLVMHGLDITHQMLVTEDRVAAFSKLPEPIGPWLADLLAFFNRYDRERYKSTGAPLHDPCTIAYLIDPTIFSGKKCNLQVETESELTRGQTVVDWWSVTGRAPNAEIITEGDDKRFFDLLISQLRNLNPGTLN